MSLICSSSLLRSLCFCCFLQYDYGSKFAFFTRVSFRIALAAAAAKAAPTMMTFDSSAAERDDEEMVDNSLFRPSMKRYPFTSAPTTIERPMHAT